MQAEEIEALQAIFPDEFSLLSPSPPYKYKIHITPNPGGESNHGNHFFVTWHVIDFLDSCCRSNL